LCFFSRGGNISPSPQQEEQMGSSGTNKFTDFPGTSRGSAKTPKGGGGASGGSPGDTAQCERPLSNVALEEVAVCDYFVTNHGLPATGTPVSVRKALVGHRIAVETTGGEVVGYLPTDFNYLLRCMTGGFSYSGKVVSAKTKPVQVVRVDLEPHK
jgi:hypothetical protein